VHKCSDHKFEASSPLELHFPLSSGLPFLKRPLSYGTDEVHCLVDVLETLERIFCHFSVPSYANLLSN
jgi:hypothetical protein